MVNHLYKPLLSGILFWVLLPVLRNGIEHLFRQFYGAIAERVADYLARVTTDMIMNKVSEFFMSWIRAP